MTPLLDAHAALVGGLVLVRIFCAFAVLPPLGGGLVPGAAKAGAALAVALALAPGLAAGVPPGFPGGPVATVALAAREALAGFAIGLVASVALHAAQAAGRLADLAIAPPSALDGPVARLYLLVAALLFFSTGAAATVVRALAESYDALPLAKGAIDTAGLADRTILATSGLLVAAVGLAAPVLLVALLTDLAIGVASRLAPRAHLALLLAPARALVAVAAVLGSVLAFGPALSGALGEAARDALEAARRLGR